MPCATPQAAAAATAVAAHTSAAAVGAHQIVVQLWMFLAFVLDALAVAAQTLVGAALGGHDRDQAHRVARQVTRLRSGRWAVLGAEMPAPAR
jgi:Na+-driven multidrug efflux pump